MNKPLSNDVTADNTAQCDPLPRLLCSMDGAYNNSKHFLYASLLCVLLSILALAFFYLKDHRALGALVALTLQLVAFWFKGRFLASYRKGHAFESAAILWHGLGESPGTGLELNYSDNRLRRRATQYKTYFFSKQADPGPLRLLEDIAECSYFIRHIANATYLVFSSLVYFGGIIILGAILAALVVVIDPRLRSYLVPAWTGDSVSVGVEIAFLALGFVAAGELAVVSNQYGFLAKKIRHVYDAAITELNSEAPSATKAMIVLLEYSSLLMEAPPISGIAYKFKKTKLNRDWEVMDAIRLAAKSTSHSDGTD